MLDRESREPIPAKVGLLRELIQAEFFHHELVLLVGQQKLSFFEKRENMPSNQPSHPQQAYSSQSLLSRRPKFGRLYHPKCCQQPQLRKLQVVCESFHRLHAQPVQTCFRLSCIASLWEGPSLQSTFGCLSRRRRSRRIEPSRRRVKVQDGMSLPCAPGSTWKRHRILRIELGSLISE